MSEVKDRLKKATETCITSYEVWEKDKKNTEVRETLMEAMHELRKAAARLEIEIAISERDQMASRPLPIPPHRSSRRKGPDMEGEDYEDDIGQEQVFGQGDGRKAQSRPPGGPRGRRRSSGGGGGQG